ncbi:MAG: FAD binding domain-containing protein, partial [Chloroflexota bacterium]
MIPAPFGYVRAQSLGDALARLAASNGMAKAIAGGQSILPLMKLRLARPELLVDIGRLSELRGIRHEPDGRISIGALTTYDELLRDDGLLQFGLLADALPAIGDVQVRNRGTIGGAVAHADPASDLSAVLLALDAGIVIRSVQGERVMPITSFFDGPFATALAADELITEIRLGAPLDDAGSAYRSIDQPASGYAIAGAAVVIGARVADRWTRCGVALTGVGDQPYRASAVEAAVLAGLSFAEAASHATEGV